jgi:hypothetical protein
VIGPPCQEETEEFDGFGEEDLMSQTTSLVSKSLSNVTFSHSCGAVKEDMLFLFDKATVAEISDEFRIEFGIEREVETLQGLFFFERGSGEPEVEFFGFSSFDFVLDYKLKEFDISQRRALGLLETEFQGLEKSPQVKHFQLLFELMLQFHEITPSPEAKYSGGLRNLCPNGERGICEGEGGVCSKENQPFSRMVLMLR